MQLFALALLCGAVAAADMPVAFGAAPADDSGIIEGEDEDTSHNALVDGFPPPPPHKCEDWCNPFTCDMGPCAHCPSAMCALHFGYDPKPPPPPPPPPPKPSPPPPLPPPHPSPPPPSPEPPKPSPPPPPRPSPPPPPPPLPPPPYAPAPSAVAAEAAGLALSLVGLVAAGLVFIPLGRGYITRMRRVGDATGAGGKPSRLPSIEDEHDVEHMMGGHGMLDDPRLSRVSGDDLCDEAGLRAAPADMETAAGEGMGAAAERVQGGGAGGDEAMEDENGWTAQTVVSSERGAQEERRDSVGMQRYDVAEEDEDEGVVVKASVARADVPTSMDDVMFKFKDVDL